MKSRTFILSFLGIALIFFGCGQEGPISPQFAQSERGTVLAKATQTPFTATLSLGAIPIDPGQITTTNGVLHIRNQVLQGPLSGDIVGTGTAVIDADVVLATGKGPGRASLTLQVTQLFGQAVSGTFQGQLQAQLLGLPTGGFLTTGSVQGQGGGGLAGMKISGTFTDAADPVNNAFALTGRILNP